ncbi:MAG: hypothetical protein WCL51_04200 [Bacteroidota bacterium]
MIDTTEIRKHIGVSIDFDCSVLTPHLNWANDTYLSEILGMDLMNKLISFNGDDSDVEVLRIPFFTMLNSKVNEMLIQIAMFDWMNISGVTISELGLQRIEGEISGVTRKSAFHYQEKNAIEYFRNKGFNAMDSVLTYIICNIAQFDEFKTAAIYSELNGSIIPNVKVFNSCYNINGSTLLFIKLKQFIREAELFDIVPSIGTALYNRIKTSLDNVDIIALLPELRNAIAYKAIAKGIETSSINIAEDGARLVLRASTRDNIEVSSKPELAALINSANETGDKYIGLLCKNIRANKTKYPEYIDARIVPIDISQSKMIPLF